MKEQPNGPCYKIQLWRALRIQGFGEELVIANFYPAMVDGFAVPLTNKLKTEGVDDGTGHFNTTSTD